MLAEKHIVAYGANDVDSLKTLELSCESDEANWTASIISLELATDDGVSVTASTYQNVDNVKVGHLILSEYTTDVDAHSQIAIHDSQHETFLFKGEAYVAGHPKKVLVFREKK